MTDYNILKKIAHFGTTVLSNFFFFVFSTPVYKTQSIFEPMIQEHAHEL